MTDIVERLRGWFETNQHPDRANEIMREAADEIERLRAVLEWFADKDNYTDCAVESEGYIRARTALGKGG